MARVFIMPRYRLEQPISSCHLPRAPLLATLALLALLASMSAGCDEQREPSTSFRVVTFNTGGGATGSNPPPGFGELQADASDELYGNGLAWNDAIEATADFLERIDPDIVVFQEIFHPGDCDEIPEEAQLGFVCETWQEGDQTVAQRVLNHDDYQIACNLGKPDKCAAVRRSFGSFVGCEGELCLDGLDGASIEGCGSGSRVGRGIIERADGSRLTLVHIHATSGLAPDDAACREAQVDQVFVDLDGAPAANGERNLIAGDINTDPTRFAASDASAARWNEFVGEDRAFHWISAFEPPTYARIVSIDHVVSDAFAGDCFVPGITPGTDSVYPFGYFDHRPIVCDLED